MSRGARPKYDAVIVGAGPNGLAAAALLAREGFATLLLEASTTVGGGTRSAELTLPGFLHDVCSAIHPMAVGSPFLTELPLASRGLEWIHPPLPLAHPLDGDDAVVSARDLGETAAGLGGDTGAYRALFGPIASSWGALAPDILGPLLRLPAHPVALARFGARALWPASALARVSFRGERARALFAGLSAHGMLPLEAPASAAIALVLGALAHARGWPLPRGGAQRIAAAIADYARDLGAEIETGRRVDALSELPSSRVVLLDLTPVEALRVAGDRLPSAYRRALRRYRYGPGVFKVDYALDGPIPWRAAACGRAGTVHVGGTLAEVAAAEDEVARGRHPERPFVLVTQPSLFDPTRAPAGRHTAWAYCHVPNGSGVDMTERIEAQLKRFAPGFRDRVLARHTRNAAELADYNPNYVGGDINGGLLDLRQIVARPALRRVPYATPDPDLFLCSSATPPGGGVHGMSGYHAARAAIARLARAPAGYSP